MENKRVTFNTAKLAKEKGFDFYDTGGYYHINEGYTYEDALEVALFECLQRVSETVA